MSIKTFKLHKQKDVWCTDDGEVINLFPSNEHLVDGVYFVNAKQIDNYWLVLRILYSPTLTIQQQSLAAWKDSKLFINKKNNKNNEKVRSFRKDWKL